MLINIIYIISYSIYEEWTEWRVLETQHSLIDPQKFH